MHRMITMHGRPRQTDRERERERESRMNIMAIARQFVLTDASRANKRVYTSINYYHGEYCCGNAFGRVYVCVSVCPVESH